MLHTSFLRRSFLSRSVQVAGLLVGFVFAWSMPAALPTSATSPGTVVAWGWNNRGQTDVPADLSGVVAIAAGQYHTVALKSDGTVVAWGDNGWGQITVPPGLSGVMAIAAGEPHTLALKSDGTVVAWGDNTYGQTTVPSGLSDVIAIAAGGYHSVALKSDGTVVAWGYNGWDESTVPGGLSGVTAIAAGFNHTAALKSDGTLVAWGRNDFGQTTVPAGLSGVTAIAAGVFHTVALKSDGTVVAWGSNVEGQTTVPPGLSGVTAIAGYDHTVALKSDGTVVAWGSNGFGQTTVPPGLSGVTAIAAGGYHTVALVAPTPTPGSLLTDLGPASVWVGLKNSDDVGIRFDLRAEAYRGATLVGSGDLASAVGGSSGFNNAKLDVIPMTPLPGVTFLPGEELKIKLLVRNACTGSGKNSGHARLWFNDSAANSRFEATIGSPATYYLRSGSILATTAGSGPKTTIDLAAGAKCSAYKSFGIWSITQP